MRKQSTSSLIAFLAVFALLAGCAGYKPRPVDIAKGEYYEDTEYEKLSKKDRETYCRALASELDGLQSRAQNAESTVTQNKDKIRNLTRELRDAERQYAAYTTEIDELTKQLQALSKLPKTWKLQYGECLWKLAGYDDIYQDPLKWPRIWRGNQQLIEDPNWVLAGWELNIPRDYPREHTVVPDEWLGKIASYWEIYGDYRKWPLIFEANRNQIRDADLIFPNQQLVIPRQDTLQ
jgi:nucleoid-associated protein YgaU